MNMLPVMLALLVQLSARTRCILVRLGLTATFCLIPSYSMFTHTAFVSDYPSMACICRCDHLGANILSDASSKLNAASQEDTDLRHHHTPASQVLDMDPLVEQVRTLLKTPWSGAQ